MKRCPNPACASMQFPDEANFCPNCAQRLVDAGPAQAAPAPADDGLLGGRFKLGARFGGNRTGELYDATDTSNGSACVVKLVHPHVFPTPLLRQRSERELKQLERVQAASVARVLGHGKHADDRLWVAVEKVDGQPLKAIVAEGALDVDRAKGILLKIGEALGEAAKVGVIHRDVSPKNVLVGAGDAVKVINFGIPTPLDERVQGEPEFLSPEQVEGKPVDQRSNIYSLGAMLYYMLTGQPPYVGDPQAVMQAHLAGELTPPSQRGAVSPAVEALIVKALDRMSSKRFMTLRQLLTEVEKSDGPSAADSASQTTPFAAAGKGPPAGSPAARTMMGMYAPGQGPVGPDGSPTDVVPVGPGAQEPATQPAAAVSSFAPPSAATPAQTTPEPQPVPQPQPAPQPQPTPQPQPVQSAPEPQPTPQPPAEPPAPSVPSLEAPQRADSQSGAGGKRRAAQAKQQKKGQFRETLWFKKGELDAVAAEAAAAAQAQGKDDLAADKADSLPMEDRYEDDGSVSVQDQQSYSLRTGHTQMMKAVGNEQASGPGMRDDDIIDEMKSGRTGVILLIVLGIALAVGVALFFLLK